MLKIKNISASSESQLLLKDIDLTVNAGEIHAIMGPKHSGKSALAHVITGHPSVQVTDGTITLGKKKIQTLDADVIAKLGVFVSFQFPPEFDSMTNWELTKEALEAHESAISDLTLKYNTCCELLDLGSSHGERSANAINMTMSMAKRNELIHMLLTDPKLVILDEIDEGLSLEDTALVGTILRNFLGKKDKGCIVFTHNQTLLKILQPTHVHVMVGGEIKLSGDTELYTRIIEDGYSEFS
jgi:Fe-S cluster assembly ATP-binding protein